LTKRNIPMRDSESLQLVLQATKISEQITLHVSQELTKKGYESATPAVLGFLSTLDCGVNYASEIARNLGVSRQMVAKTVKEFIRLGYLEQQAGIGKQKEILFTEKGEHLMSDSRAILADIDKRVADDLNDKALNETLNKLTDIQQTLNHL